MAVVVWGGEGGGGRAGRVREGRGLSCCRQQLCQASTWLAENGGAFPPNTPLHVPLAIPPPPSLAGCSSRSIPCSPAHTCTRGNSAPAGFQSWVGGRSDEGTASGRQSCAAKRQQRAREWTTTPQCSQDYRREEAEGRVCERMGMHARARDVYRRTEEKMQACILPRIKCRTMGDAIAEALLPSQHHLRTCHSEPATGFMHTQQTTGASLPTAAEEEAHACGVAGKSAAGCMARHSRMACMESCTKALPRLAARYLSGRTMPQGGGCFKLLSGPFRGS